MSRDSRRCGWVQDVAAECCSRMMMQQDVAAGCCSRLGELVCRNINDVHCQSLIAILIGLSRRKSPAESPCGGLAHGTALPAENATGEVPMPGPGRAGGAPTRPLLRVDLGFLGGPVIRLGRPQPAPGPGPGQERHCVTANWRW